MAADETRVMPIPTGLTAPGARGGEFAAVAHVDDLPVGTMVRFTRGDLDLLVVHSPAGVCVTDDRCPHMAAPLSVGTLDDCLVACPLHRGQFDLSTGEVVQFPTTGGLDADGNSRPPWSPADSTAKEQPTDLKARARAATRVRRMRYYPVRIVEGNIEAQLPAI